MGIQGACFLVKTFEMGFWLARDSRNTFAFGSNMIEWMHCMQHVYKCQLVTIKVAPLSSNHAWVMRLFTFLGIHFCESYKCIVINSCYCFM
jgi:hypothetical protein